MFSSTVSSTVTVITTVPAIARRNRVLGVREVGEIHGLHDLNPNLVAAPLQQRQVTESPSVIPKYASACSSPAAYSSACTCIGITRVTITAAGKTTSTIVTATHTVSSTPLSTRIAEVSSTSSTISSSPSTSGSTTSAPVSSSSTRPALTNSTSIYTNTSTSLPSPTRTVLDTTCGETSTPFQLQVSSPSSPFDKWFAHLSGDGILFTSEASSATSFSIEASRHLCAVGYEGIKGYPVIAVIGNATDSGAVWFLDGKIAQVLGDDYVAIECDVGGGGLKCEAQGREDWFGCGLQLDLGSGERTEGDGIECKGVELRIV